MADAQMIFARVLCRRDRQGPIPKAISGKTRPIPFSAVDVRRETIDLVTLGAPPSTPQVTMLPLPRIR
ncbi:MAG TPA: hypothetical protein VJ717_02265, partial [Gemmatimonadaceae bacterium]|nr:hypothetical protein [Gemmatimonadaceae bacterium]